ncbi:MAG TPA: MarR family transcriptional regulator [Acidimicrobiales bacterium]|nr:MarR family transcriptional regulator [Acidimicrobiales bacterium]
MADTTAWLTDEQQRVWRALLQLTTRLPARLNRQLQEDSGLSLADVDVLVGLTDAPDGRVRVTGLARALGWERSRLSHQVARMARAGLVRREACEDDRRGSYVAITDAGRGALAEAAPAHVALARELVVDALAAEDLGRLGALVDTVLDRIDDPS